MILKKNEQICEVVSVWDCTQEAVDDITAALEKDRPGDPVAVDWNLYNNTVKFTRGRNKSVQLNPLDVVFIDEDGDICVLDADVVSKNFKLLA